MEQILAQQAGFNPFNSVATLGLKGLVIIGLALLAGAVAYVVLSWFKKGPR